MSSKNILFVVLSILLITSVMAENLWNGNKISVRGSDKYGTFYINGEDNIYTSAKLSLSVSRIRRDEGRGSLTLVVGRDRLTLNILPREKINIIEWADNKIIISQKARIKYKDYKGITDVNYTIYLNENKADISFNVEDKNIQLSMIDLSYYRCFKQKCYTY